MAKLSTRAATTDSATNRYVASQRDVIKYATPNVPCHFLPQVRLNSGFFNYGKFKAFSQNNPGNNSGRLIDNMVKKNTFIALFDDPSAPFIYFGPKRCGECSVTHMPQWDVIALIINHRRVVRSKIKYYLHYKASS